SSIAQVVEQLVRVTIIIIGSYLSAKVFHFNLRTTVGIALSGASLGAIASYLYLLIKMKKNQSKIKFQTIDIEEPKIKYQAIMKKIIIYALPFILIDLSRSLVQTIDIFSLVKILVSNLGYDVNYAETVISIITTWGNKLNNIVVSITTGIMVSLVPNLTTYLTENNIVEVRKKINQTIQLVIYLTIPMTIGLSFLASPVWTLFYGTSELGPQVFAFNVLTCVANSLLITTCTIALTLKENKNLYISLITIFLLKLLLNKPLIYCCYGLALPGYIGSIIATMIAFIVPTIMIIIVIGKKHQVNYEKTIKEGFNILISSLVMVILLMLLKLVIPIDVSSRLLAILLIIIYTAIGALIYIIMTKKTKTIDNIFGKNFLKKLIYNTKKEK
ncbi:MAG: hypothetical protein GX861_03215, partial [Tenericutes bacterium]|nr:hypothetical protein [Mycoplasmatota bacterium]